MKRALKSIAWYAALIAMCGTYRFLTGWNSFKGQLQEAWKEPA